MYRIVYRELEDDELMHWKYVKRERVNGRWRYYYDDSSFKDKKKAYEDAEKNLTTKQLRYLLSKSAVKTNYDLYTKDGNEKLSDAESKRMTEFMSKMTAYESDYTIAGVEFTRAKSEYMNAKLSHIPAAVISKGMVAVKNAISAIDSLNQKLKKKVGVTGETKVTAKSSMINYSESTAAKTKKKQAARTNRR